MWYAWTNLVIRYILGKTMADTGNEGLATRETCTNVDIQWLAEI